jgi:hypothetical protein
MRLQATGKFKREAVRVLKRRLVRVIFNLLHADLDQTGLGQSAAPLAGSGTSRVTSERCAVGRRQRPGAGRRRSDRDRAVAADHEAHLILTI